MTRSNGVGGLTDRHIRANLWNEIAERYMTLTSAEKGQTEAPVRFSVQEVQRERRSSISQRSPSTVDANLEHIDNHCQAIREPQL